MTEIKMTRECILLGKFAQHFCALIDAYAGSNGPTLHDFVVQCQSLQDEKNEGIIASIHPRQVLKISNSVLSFFGFEASSLKSGLEILCSMAQQVTIHQSNRNAFVAVENEFLERLEDLQGVGSFDDGKVFSAWNYLAAMIVIVSYKQNRIPKCIKTIRKGLYVQKSKVADLIFENLE
jgi:hypothetical protein